MDCLVHFLRILSLGCLLEPGVNFSNVDIRLSVRLHTSLLQSYPELWLL